MPDNSPNSHQRAAAHSASPRFNGSGTFSNNISHTLILGSAGVDDITDSGQDNCIVGGGAKDNVHADSTDVCIIGPTSGAVYHQCVTRTS